MKVAEIEKFALYIDKCRLDLRKIFIKKSNPIFIHSTPDIHTRDQDFDFYFTLLKSLETYFLSIYHRKVLSLSQIKDSDSSNLVHAFLTITMKSPQNGKRGFAPIAFSDFLDFSLLVKTSTSTQIPPQSLTWFQIQAPFKNHFHSQYLVIL